MKSFVMEPAQLDVAGLGVSDNGKHALVKSIQALSTGFVFKAYEGITEHKLPEAVKNSVRENVALAASGAIEGANAKTAWKAATVAALKWLAGELHWSLIADQAVTSSQPIGACSSIGAFVPDEITKSAAVLVQQPEILEKFGWTRYAKDAPLFLIHFPPILVNNLDSDKLVGADETGVYAFVSETPLSVHSSHARTIAQLGAVAANMVKLHQTMKEDSQREQPLNYANRVFSSSDVGAIDSFQQVIVLAASQHRNEQGAPDSDDLVLFNLNGNQDQHWKVVFNADDYAEEIKRRDLRTAFGWVQVPEVAGPAKTPKGKGKGKADVFVPPKLVWKLESAGNVALVVNKRVAMISPYPETAAKTRVSDQYVYLVRENPNNPKDASVHLVFATSETLPRQISIGRETKLMYVRPREEWGPSSFTEKRQALAAISADNATIKGAGAVCLMFKHGEVEAYRREGTPVGGKYTYHQLSVARYHSESDDFLAHIPVTTMSVDSAVEGLQASLLLGSDRLKEVSKAINVRGGTSDQIVENLRVQCDLIATKAAEDIVQRLTDLRSGMNVVFFRGEVDKTQKKRKNVEVV